MGRDSQQEYTVALTSARVWKLLAGAAKARNCTSSIDILSDRMLPQRAEQIDNYLRAGQTEDAILRSL